MTATPNVGDGHPKRREWPPQASGMTTPNVGTAIAKPLVTKQIGEFFPPKYFKNLKRFLRRRAFFEGGAAFEGATVAAPARTKRAGAA